MSETQATPAPQQAPPSPLASLPELPCPNCGANILEHHGFHNYCTETQSLREDSYLYTTRGRIYLDHDESDYETDSHECQATAYCSECDNELPWSLFEIREMSGETVESAKDIIQSLVAEADSEDESDEDGEQAPPAEAATTQEVTQ